MALAREILALTRRSATVEAEDGIVRSITESKEPAIGFQSTSMHAQRKGAEELAATSLQGRTKAERLRQKRELI